MTATVVERDPVTAAFLSIAGGFCIDGVRLLRVIRPPSSPNGKTVLMEDCWTLKAEEMDRADLLKLKVAKWPKGLH